MWNLVRELQRTVSRLQAQVEEGNRETAAPSHDEAQFDGDYQPPFHRLQSDDEEDGQIRKFFMNTQKVLSLEKLKSELGRSLILFTYSLGL